MLSEVQCEYISVSVEVVMLEVVGSHGGSHGGLGTTVLHCKCVHTELHSTALYLTQSHCRNPTVLLMFVIHTGRTL